MRRLDVKHIMSMTFVMFTMTVMSLIATADVAAAQATVDEPERVFAAANASYESGDYESAVTAYLQLADAGASDPHLFYNLGNTFYKLGALGHAVLYYERGLRLAPRDEDIRKNLSLVESLLRDRQFLADQSWVVRAASWPHRNLRAEETVVVAVVFYFLLVMATLLLIFRRTTVAERIRHAVSFASAGRLLGLSRTQDLITAVSVLLILTTGAVFSASSKGRAESARHIGVVLEEEVAVYSGPSEDATLQFKIHQGTRVKVDEARPGWLEIQLPGELTGWISSSALERI
jgi:tetratricopeptide (TPR) repeat protein